MYAKKIKISCVILAKNEEKNIVHVIRSVRFCDEIILIDDYSEDETSVKAKALGAIMYQRKLDDDFASQRNYGMEKTRGEWILFVDADEEVTNELAEEIKNIVNTNKQSPILTNYIRRRDIFWGRELYFGETGNLKFIRLVRKNSGSWQGKVHEIYKTNGHIGILKNDLIHRPHPTIKDFLSEINYYSSIRAKELSIQNIKTNIFEIIFYPFSKFIFNYLLRGGFFDGSSGFVYAFAMSFHSFLVRSKLYLTQSKNSLSKV